MAAAETHKLGLHSPRSLDTFFLFLPSFSLFFSSGPFLSAARYGNAPPDRIGYTYACE